ncbi:MAG: 16S rRNA (guanine(966)-N(2))-methyltransferase RsmD [Actinomycetota bacterium]|nr:MAG: 16S rRNA (guanine(966)-N(2))-methyltransferase RsmD [Actinomycetota bacterium]
MRVVAGTLRGRRILAPEGRATRPTTDKVREAVFNALSSLGLVEDAAVADLYAGCGALGIEALSRGAATCVFVERDRDALTMLRTNLANLGLTERARVVPGDVGALAGTLAGLDLVLADPPYGFTGWDGLLGRLSAPFVVAESDEEVVGPDGWEAVRSRRYGRTWVTFLQRVP